jgi:hypothetical protein
MTREDLKARLLEPPGLIAEAETKLLTLEEQCRVAKDALQQVEDTLLLGHFDLPRPGIANWPRYLLPGELCPGPRQPADRLLPQRLNAGVSVPPA